MSIIERIVVFCIFGLPGTAIIGYNYYRIFSKKCKSSPAYIIGGILGAVGVLALLGDAWKEKWYFILIPIVLDWGLFLVSLFIAIFVPPKNINNIEENDE